MSINVTVVGGPYDGIEVAVPDGYHRVHMVEACESDCRLQDVHQAGISIHQFTMPVRLTRNGYRCYWSERDH